MIFAGSILWKQSRKPHRMVARGERKKTAKLEVDGAASSLAESWLDEMQKASGRPVSGGDESEDVGAPAPTASRPVHVRAAHQTERRAQTRWRTHSAIGVLCLKLTHARGFAGEAGAGRQVHPACGGAQHRYRRGRQACCQPQGPETQTRARGEGAPAE